MASTLPVMTSTLIAMASNLPRSNGLHPTTLPAMASTLLGMASNLEAMTSTLLPLASNLIRLSVEHPSGSCNPSAEPQGENEPV